MARSASDATGTTPFNQCHAQANKPARHARKETTVRLIGLILALGAMSWVLYQAAGGDDAESVIPQAHQDAMQQAQELEASLQVSLEQKLEEAAAHED
ncbi:MAG: hypothetical protein NXI15_08020 [Gammaproteobacteria bacterium]|nr:hypothetical protein [Gammaproteobacteria bacterium]